MHSGQMTTHDGRRGIVFCPGGASDPARMRQRFREHLESLGLLAFVNETKGAGAPGTDIRFCLRPEVAEAWAPADDTTGLARLLGYDTVGNIRDLEREIVLTLLQGAQLFCFPSIEEFLSAIRIRCNIVNAARKTALSFDTEATERPPAYWTYSDETGFTLIPGKNLIEALLKATQPEISGKRYAFSCYRATEYVILLAVAQELRTCNPELLAALQRQWESQAIMSGRFHEIFLHEYGSMEDPLPARYYVPGDRLWFRNPDPRSSDVPGYEGSWVFYLGDGLFSNFWKYEQPYTLIDKCLEIFHWRNAVVTDPAGRQQIDEAIVEAGVAASRSDPAESARILATMLRYREPQGVYVAGGCLDTSREYPRRVCPDTSDIVLPQLEMV